MRDDKEYTCTWNAERTYLSDHGVRYEFVKVVKGLTIYKYKKTEKLFATLARFYGELGIKE